MTKQTSTRIKFWFLLFIFIIPVFAGSVIAQNFKGRIIDKNGEPIYGSTIFVKEINQGLACNINGEYQTTLKPGKYTAEYRCMGYKNIQRQIVITANETSTENVILETTTYELKEVVIANGEDPAYKIMRKAIEKAPYQRALVNYFKAESYIKGTFELKKVSKLIDKHSSVGDTNLKLSDFKDKLFLQESYNEVEYTAPDKYTQTVKAFSSTIPDNFKPDDVLNALDNSLYQPTFEGLISPLNPKAFSYYKFRYEGFTEDGNTTVNKIKIISKYNNPSLVNGYIYIAEDSWEIRSAELSATLWGLKNEFSISYGNVAKNTYLPISYTNRMTMDMLGVEGYFNYFSSIKYQTLEINTKDDPENYKLEKEKKKRDFEIKPDTMTYKIRIDSLSTKRDSLYWSDIRNTPLSDREILSYTEKDSIQNSIDSVRNERTNRKFRPTSLITGGQIGGDSAKVEIKYSGLFGMIGDYNFVDGFWLGQKLAISTKIGDKNKITFTPNVYYASARKDLICNADLELQYAPMRMGNLLISGGSITEDFNPEGITRTDNFLGSLLWAKNYNMLYERKYLSVSNSIDLANGLKLKINMNANKRIGVENNTDFYFQINNKPIADFLLLRSSHKNIRSNRYFSEPSYLTAYSIGLSYAPYAYYTIQDGKKTYRHVTSPIFDLYYSQGISVLDKNNSLYRQLQAGIRQRIKLDVFSSFNYNIQAGAFLGDKSQINEIDYKGFNTSNLVWMGKQPGNTFVMLDAYKYSTNDYWANAFLTYSSQYLLLKRLPFMQNTFLQENLHLKTLYTPDLKFYSEIGYSVGFLGRINLGIFASFNKTDFSEACFRLSTVFDFFR
ncbi:MAG: DUF5686 and carboxypeptidase regulatory-like domain-containing protein [Dysgonomonas sp.]